MRSQSELVTHLLNTGVLHSVDLTRSFERVDRKDFIVGGYEEQAYEDYPLPIGYGQTISQPYTVAFMLELLQLRASDSVMEIGAGSGWATALMAGIVKEVRAVERIAQLVEFARENLSKYRFSNVTVEQAGHALGIPDSSFDKILVSAAADQLPEELLKQLRPGGIMVIPVQDRIDVVFKDTDGACETVSHYGFAFVPLVY